MKWYFYYKKLIYIVLLALYAPLTCLADVDDGTITVDDLDPAEVGYDFIVDGIYYKKLGGDSVSTSEGEKPYVGRIVIPDVVEYEGTSYRITKVSGFRNSPDVTEVTIPKYTKMISGFYGRVASLSGGPGIKIPSQKSDTTVATVFSKLEKVYFNADNCEEVYYSVHTSTMLGGGYNGYLSIFPFSLQSIEFGENVERIPNGLLYGCTSIKEIVFPKSVKYIGWLIIAPDKDNIVNCELLCEDLQEIAWLPKNQECVELGSDFHTYPCGKEHYLREILNGRVDASTYSNVFHDFIGLDMTGDGTIDLPKWVRKIAPNAFMGYESKLKLNISENIVAIEMGTFENCHALEEVTIPASVKSIGRAAFKGCSNLKTLYFNATDCVSEQDVFSECSSLTDVVFAENVTKIPDSLFTSCSGLKTLTIPNTISEIGVRAFENSGITVLTIPVSVTKIGEGAFLSCEELSTLYYNAPNSTNGSSIFANCHSLREVIFGENVAKIPDNLLMNCNGLNILDIPNTVTEIGDHAFEGTKITQLTIPATITDIGIWAFAFCPELKTVYYNAANCNSTNAPFHSSPVEKVLMGDGVIKVPEAIFMNCEGLKELVLPNSVKEIGKYAFWGTGLSELTLPQNLEKICEGAFSNCLSITTLYYNARNCVMDRALTLKSLNSVVIGADVEKVPSYMLSDCDALTEITIPANVTKIGGFSFAYCDNLSTIYFNAVNCETETAENGSDNVFWTCPSLESAVIGDNVKAIPKRLLADCNNIKSINLPNTLEEIGDGALTRTGLTEIVIPGHVTHIGEGAFASCDNLTTLHFEAENCSVVQEETDMGLFYYCASLSNVTFGVNVTKIPNGLLSGCKMVSKIDIPETVTEIGAYAFSNTGLKEIIIPNAVEKIGCKALYSCFDLATVIIGNYVSEIGSRAFASNNIKNVQSLSKIPPTMPEDTFFDLVYKNATLTIPNGTTDAYKMAIGWEKFTHYTEAGSSSLRGVNGTSDDEKVTFYNLQGIEVNNPQKGIFIRKQGNEMIKVVL